MASTLFFAALIIAPRGAILAQENPLTAQERRQVVDRIADLVVQRYVYEDVGLRTADHIRKKLAAGAFDEMTDGETFARVLTEELQSVNRDRHMRVRLRPMRGGDEETAPDPITMRTRFTQGMRERNFGFARLEHLEGNIGYLDLRGFFPEEMARETAVAAMAFLAHSDAIIIDLRKNGGGNPATIRLICSYFFDEPTHLNSLYWREGDRTEEFWTLDEVEGRRMADVPLFVLTSDYTFSGAEEFAYNLKTRNRAVIVGETTGGGANPGGSVPVEDRFEIFIPTGRAINPVTGTNWEGTGVEPDVKVPADDAFDRGLELARKSAEEHRQERGATTDLERSRLIEGLQTAEEMAGRHADSDDVSKAVSAALGRALAADLLDEQTINMMGYDYLGRDDTEMAIAVFAFNVSAYPESSNVYDSLGEAYMGAGRRGEAIANYRRSLELDPANGNAVEMLRRLGVDVQEG